MKRLNGVHPVLHLDGDDTLHMTQRANGVWYYQRRIPISSQPFFKGKTTLKISLRTTSKTEAARRARELSVEHDKLFEEQRRLSHDNVDNTSVRGLSLTERALLKQTQDNVAKHAAKDLITSQSLFALDASSKAQREAAYSGIEELRDNLNEFAQDLVDDEISVSEVRQNEMWKVFEGALADDQYETLKALSEHQQHQVFLEFTSQTNKWLPQLISKLQNPLRAAELPSPSIEYNHNAQPEIETGEYLSKCIELYLESRSHDQIRPKTLERYAARLRLLLYIIDDQPINSLRRSHALEFKDKLIRLPANMNKIAKYKGLTVDEVLALDPSPMASNTANDTMTDVGSFFDWCVLNEYALKNSFKGLKMKVSKRASDERAAFDMCDLTTLFQHSYFQGGKVRHPHYYWLPVLGVYTGARLNELCQLHVGDIRTDSESNLWTMTITASREDQNTKNVSSERTIPLHSKLIELGFIEYVQSLSHERVFPELKKGRDGYGQAPSKWFARLRDKVLPNAGNEGKSFHSFRHTFINELKQLDAPKTHAAAYVGHGENSETFGRYGKAYVASTLKPVVELITYDFNIAPYVLPN
ncbi:site-specific integrase [Vibrio harveyi]|nr:site-specific integrase [Vibrio harveyi]